MATYRFKIVGVHYAINPDSTSREEETELMHQRTAQRLRELDEKRPVVVLIPEPTNPVEERAVMARVEGARIGYVSTAQLDTLHALFVASGVRILKATIESVEARKHGWMEVCVETEEEVRIEPQNQQESPWTGWTSNLPELPVIDSRFAQMEAEVMLDDVLSKYPILALQSIAPQSDTESHGVLLSNHPDGEKEKLCGTPCNSVVKEELNTIESYIRLWLESSLHDLSNEARLMREHYIMRLKEMMSQNATPSPKPLPRIRGLVFELEKQRTAICGQKRMNLRVGKWWKSLLASEEMGRLWKTWVARTDGNWEQGVNELVTPLRALPFDLYVYIDDKKVFFSRLHYSQVPRKKYWQIISLMLLHERTLMEMKKEEEGCNQTLLPCQDEETGNETFTVTIPQELETPEAKKVLARLQKKGILDDDLQPVKLSNTQKAVLAWELTERLRIKKRWAVMATLWKCNPETLRKSRDKGYDKNVSHEFEKFIKPIIHY